MAELVSVIVPVYNCEKYIRECVESILGQTYPNVEIILVDDGSTDSSGMICDTYAEKYQNITSIHQKNAGISSARLAGTEICNGTWVTFVDADDWIKNNYYEVMCKETDGCDIVTSGIIRWFNESDFKEDRPRYKSGIYDRNKIAEQIIPGMLWDSEIWTWALDPSLCTKLFRRELVLEELRKAAKVGSDYGEDSMVIFPMMFRVEKMKVVEGAFYYHRQRAPGKFSDYLRDEMFVEKLTSVYLYLKREFQKVNSLNIMQKQLDIFCIDSMEIKKRVYGYGDTVKYNGFILAFPFSEIERGSKVILYGAGKVGQTYMKQNEEYHFCTIVSWVDKNYKQISLKNSKEVEGIDVISKKEFDYVVIAVDRYDVAAEIGKYLTESGVPKEKIIWESKRKCTARIF